MRAEQCALGSASTGAAAARKIEYFVHTTDRWPAGPRTGCQGSQSEACPGAHRGIGLGGDAHKGALAGGLEVREQVDRREGEAAVALHHLQQGAKPCPAW
jgi:hypothetical protein